MGTAGKNESHESDEIRGQVHSMPPMPHIRTRYFVLPPLVPFKLAYSLVCLLSADLPIPNGLHDRVSPQFPLALAQLPRTGTDTIDVKTSYIIYEK